MFTLKYAKNPQWNDEQKTQILLTIKWEEFVEEMPFNACSWDPEAHGVDLFNRAAAGEFGAISPFVSFLPPAIDFEPTPTSGTQTL